MNSTLPELLPFDGSHLGDFDFDKVISWCYPCRPDRSVFFALIGPRNLPIVLKRNTSKRADQCVIDELKPLFGLHKMGSHRVRLYGIPRKFDPEGDWLVYHNNNVYLNAGLYFQWSDYYVFQATGNDRIPVTPVYTLGETVWSPPDTAEFKQEHWDYYYEIQKIFIYRILFRVTSKSLKDILVKKNPTRFVSINETKARDPRTVYKQPSEEIMKFFFPKSRCRSEILIKMLGLTKENHPDRLGILKTAMLRIVERIDQDKFWLVDSVVDQISDMITIHFDLT